MSKRNRELKYKLDAEFSQDFEVIMQRAQAVVEALYSSPCDPASMALHRAETMKRLGELKELMYVQLHDLTDDLISIHTGPKDRHTERLLDLDLLVVRWTTAINTCHGVRRAIFYRHGEPLPPKMLLDLHDPAGNQGKPN